MFSIHQHMWKDNKNTRSKKDRGEYNFVLLFYNNILLPGIAIGALCYSSQ